MKIALIAAMDKNRVIGYNNQLPWHLPADLQHFKKITIGKPIIMGRKTYESIGTPLPGRKNIVLTSDQHYAANGIQTAQSLAEALNKCDDKNTEVMIIGGAEIFKQALPLAQRLYLTYIEQTFPGDTFFPEINETNWKQVSEEFHEPDEKNNYPYRFVVLESAILQSPI